MIDGIAIAAFALGGAAGAAMAAALQGRRARRVSGDATLSRCAGKAAETSPSVEVAPRDTWIDAEPPRADTDATPFEPLAPASSQRPAARERVLREPALKSRREHAEALLEWVRDAGLPAQLTARQLDELYGEMCVEFFWTLHPWQSVAAELNRMSGLKPYAYVSGVRTRVYRLDDFKARKAAAAPKSGKPRTGTAESEQPLAHAA